MLRHPKTLPADASLEQVEVVLGNDHVHMVLLTEGRTLVGTLVRTDLPPVGTEGPALPWSRLAGRTVSPDATTLTVPEHLVDRGIRRLAVVAADGTLLGLICVKRHGGGFCSDAGVASRARDRGASRRTVHADERTS